MAKNKYQEINHNLATNSFWGRLKNAFLGFFNFITFGLFSRKATETSKPYQTPPIKNFPPASVPESSLNPFGRLHKIQALQDPQDTEDASRVFSGTFGILGGTLQTICGGLTAPFDNGSTLATGVGNILKGTGNLVIGSVDYAARHPECNSTNWPTITVDLSKLNPNQSSVRVSQSAHIKCVATCSFPLDIQLEQGNITFTQDIPANSTIISKSGDIKCRNIGLRSIVKSISGDIDCHHIGQYAQVKSISGDINCRTIEQYAKVQSISGDINCRTIEQYAKVQSTSGDICYDAKVSSSTVETCSGTINEINRSMRL